MPRITSVSIVDNSICFNFSENEKNVEYVIFPLETYPILCNAPVRDRNFIRVLARGTLVSWPKLDFELSVSALFDSVS